MFYALISLCGIMSFISIRSTFFLFKMGTSFAWWALLMYWIGADLLVDGTPEDIAVMLVIAFFALVFMYLGITNTGKHVDVEEERAGNNVIKRIFKYSTSGNEIRQPAGRESEAEYRARVKHALALGKKKR